MRNSEIYIITCYAEIDLNGIPTVLNLTEINRASETRKFLVNVMEILTEILNRNPVENNPEITKRTGITGNYEKNHKFRSNEC